MGPIAGQVCEVKPQGFVLDGIVNWNAELQECNGFELAIPGVGVSLFCGPEDPRSARGF